ncbi:hemerythrin domain-containing protein [Pseudoponticoccus marisrubri]|uniref:Cation-binding protein n=1 Tax=Pseudoponticoccus marisrubri TaxID=1685382 RepID=A0A0W7WNB3_9RHOB|nr:hemerythrin domain-containing protein [Pseudoponticoccus marisrubri]KUF12007.1 cation-binding protein [Pseudoponticoccus marisrubri]
MTTNIIQRQGLPTEMQALLRAHPRDGWARHPHFARAIQHWMGAHDMFRRLAFQMREDGEAFLDGRMVDPTYADRLGHLGHRLVTSLHGHHRWEDRRFFPELEAADPRFARGLEMLEQDHAVLDATLERVTRHGNRAVQLAVLDPAAMGAEVRPLRDAVEALQGFLDRHLRDEEDLAVPILLHHGLRA